MNRKKKRKKNFLDKVIVCQRRREIDDFKRYENDSSECDLFVPKKDYAKISARLLNGSFKMKDADAETVRVKTANGKIEVAGLMFKNAEFETANGAIALNGVTGTTLEAETLNGRVYIDGA